MNNNLECLAVIENNHLKVNHFVIALILLFVCILFLNYYFNKDVIEWYQRSAITFFSFSLSDFIPL